MSPRGPAKIMVVAGGSGGHILPAVAFCEALTETSCPGCAVVFVTSSSKGLEELVSSTVKTYVLSSRRSVWGLCRLLFQAAGLLMKERPGIVVGFGGYLTVPFVSVGRLLGAKVMIHEQNVLPGRANRILGALVAHRVIISFERSRAYFGKKSRKVFLARYPLRRALQPVARHEALAQLGLREGIFTVLVIGGSQGAHRLNQAFTDAVRLNKDRGRWQIIHCSGAADLDFVRRAYDGLGVKSKVFAFLAQMHYAYSVADLVVARSGAGCVHEMMRFGLPSVLVPYPHAGQHQLENAKVLAEKGAALLLEEKRLTPELLSGLLDLFAEDAFRRRTMASIARSLDEASENMSVAEAVLA